MTSSAGSQGAETETAPAPGVADPPAHEDLRAHRADDPPTEPARWTSERLALGAFVLLLVAAVPLILFHYGSYHWFFRDDFNFLADRGGRLPDLMAPHANTHWSAVPRAVYFVLWQFFGLTTYVPYQAAVVAMHLTAVTLLRLTMRRAGVGPWMATAAAAVMVLFGPGAQDIVWGFQVGFTGAIAYGLMHLLLADHDGPADRRDLLGLGAGLLSIMSSGTGVTMVMVVGLAVLLRRGWRMALLHTAPLAAIYAMWALVFDAQSTSPFGTPSPSVLLSWVRSAEIGVFLGIGHFQVLAGLLVVVLVAGLVLTLGPWREESWPELRTRLSMPLALFVGGLAFAATTGLGRWYTGDAMARSSRYVYMGALLALPLLAVAAQAVARRWRPLTPVLVGMFLLPIPFNLAAFDPAIFGPRYMEQREDVLTTAVRMPFANQVPHDVQPLPDPFASDKVNMGFLLTAERNGDLIPSTRPIGPKTTDEFRVRLGVAARPIESEVAMCQMIEGPTEISPQLGDRFVLRDGARIGFQRDGEASGGFIDFQGGPSLGELTVELPDLDLIVAPPKRAQSTELCPVG